jgi:type I restriction enzyme S subunit
MARAIFKSWFVDFLPVRAKMAARTQTGDPVRPKAEGRDTGLPMPLADLFPDRFEDSELGEIPAGWRVGNVEDLAKLSRESLNPGNFPNEIFDHYSIPAFDEGRSPKAELGEAIKSNKLQVTKESVLLSKLNPRIRRVWLPDLCSSRRPVCSTEFLVALPKPGISREFLFSIFSGSAFINQFATLVTGTSGSHQRVKPESRLAMSPVLPLGPVIESFTAAMRPLLEHVSRNIEQSRTLAALRDTLLPKLLSGEIRVNDTEKVTKGTV